MATQTYSGLRTPIVTSLPTSPVDGQEIRYLADAANGIVWNLRYRAASSSAYKWEFIGGQELVAQDFVSRAISFGANTWGSNTPVLSINVPLAGDYDIENGCTMQNGTSTSAMQVGLNIAGVAPVGGGDVSIGYNAVSTASQSLQHRRRVTGLAAGAAVIQQQQHNGTNPSNIVRIGAFLRARPVRVG